MPASALSYALTAMMRMWDIRLPSSPEAMTMPLQNLLTSTSLIVIPWASVPWIQRAANRMPDAP